MDADQPQNFNERLSQWVASQGFWFQLRYSLSGGGGWSVALFHLVRMGGRVLILLAVAALVFAFYLTKRVDSEAFSEGLRDRFMVAMSASEAEIVDFERVHGVGKIRRIGAEGTSTSFFQTIEAGNLSFNMGFFDGLKDEWDAGIIEGNWIDVQVKAGANSPEEAKAAAGNLFKRRREFDVLGLRFSRARVTWGYDERVGEIEGSKLVANRVSEGWRFSFKGGTFTQNWIRGAEIEEMVMLCTPDELIVEKGSLTLGEGHIGFKGVKIEGGELPKISGSLILLNVPIDRLVPVKIAERVSGSISGELEFSGSTNTTSGISLEGSVKLGERDVIQIRDEFPLLEALDVIDVFNSYKRVVFNQGGFNLKTGGGEMLISDLKLEARDFMSLEGMLRARYPTSDEVARSIGENTRDGIRPMVREQEEVKSTKDLTLKRAAEAEKNESDEEDSDAKSEKTEFFAALATKRDKEALGRAVAQRALNSLIFEGKFMMSIPGDALGPARDLRERYPLNPETGRIEVEVPLNGTLPELTLRQAEELLKVGGNDR